MNTAKEISKLSDESGDCNLEAVQKAFLSAGKKADEVAKHAHGGDQGKDLVRELYPYKNY